VVLIRSKFELCFQGAETQRSSGNQTPSAYRGFAAVLAESLWLSVNAFSFS